MNFICAPRIEARVRKRMAGGICVLSIVSLAGCTVGPKYKRPAAEVPPAYKEVGDWKPAQPSDEKLSGNWWEIFQDPQLNALEQQVNVSNQNLKAAQAAYTQARAALRYQRADYFPTLTVNPTLTRNNFSVNRQPRSPTFNGVTFTDIQIPFELSYQVDAWGRIRRTVESYRDQAQASAADLATVSLSMHAQLALFYYQARSLDAQEQLLNSTVEQYQEALDLIENRFAGGLASDLEVQQAKTQLETTAAQAIDVGVARAQFEHAVAVLMGKPPASFTLAPLPLTMPPPPIPAGLPSELLERRSDIAAAERLMASANAQIGVAKAAYYPLINLAAAGGFESGKITTLISGPSTLWSVGPSAVFTLFDVGRRRALSDEAISFYDQSVANYRQTVLTGFQQVEDNVAALRILEHEAEVEANAVIAAQKYLELAITRYKGGVTSYLEVTTAQSAALSDEITAVNILGRRMVDAVTLVQALGGGWDSSALPARPECCGKLTSKMK
ncbi:MAG: Heavy metal efflux outer membrane protein CzcC family [Candidatus Acidoferrum typicum]|nr:Heavy metal efflux outer membrane protein CzcC family [Candidatus Acidoferrum typicum]